MRARKCLARGKLGPADPNERITVTIVLRRGSAPSAFPSVEQLGATAPMERHHLSREEFAARHGASADDISKVRAFAKQYGLQVVEESPERRSVFLSGTVEAFSKAFSVQLNRYQHAKGTYRCRTGRCRFQRSSMESLKACSDWITGRKRRRTFVF